MIRNALSVMPTRPILYIAPLIIILVMSFYYRDLYSKCADIRQFRASLNEVLHAPDASAQFRLMDYTNFIWDKVRVVTDFRPEHKGIECPFDWNWSSGERESLITAGLLTILVFGQEGTIVEYLELRGDEVAFEGTDSGLTPQTAVFSIAMNPDNAGGVTLTLNH
jgi:hypothetical protein